MDLQKAREKFAEINLKEGFYTQEELEFTDLGVFECAAAEQDFDMWWECLIYYAQPLIDQKEKALLEQFEINNKLVEQIEKLKDQVKDTERLNFLLAGEHIRTVVKRDIENDDYEVVGSHYLFTELYWIDGFDYHENTSAHSERDAIDKAMIEAQEPTND